MTDTPRPGDLGQALDFGDLITAFRRRWRVVVAGTSVGLVVGLMLATLLPPELEASTTMLVQPIGVDLTQPESRQGLVEPALEMQLVRSTDVLSEAARAVQPAADAEALRRNLVVTSVADTSLLVLSTTATSEERALELVDAVTTAYLDQRRQRALDDVASRTTSVELRLTAAEDELQNVNEDLADLAESGLDNVGRRSLLEGRRDVLTDQVLNLQQQLATLLQLNVEPGRITERPRITDDGGFAPVLTVIGGTMLGLLLGAGLALLRDRADTRIWNTGDIERLVPDVPVVAIAPRELEAQEFLDGPTYREIRDLVISFPVPSATTLVMLSPRTDEVVPYVAAGVAGAVARAGLDTLLLDPVGFASGTGVSPWLGIDAAAPTRLDDYLFRDVPLRQAATVATRRPNLWFLQRSNDAVDRDVTVAPRLRQLLWRQQGRRPDEPPVDEMSVVVAGPGVIDSPDGAVLGGMGGAVAIVCRERVTTSEDLLRTLRSLRTHTASVVTIVLVPNDAPR